MLVFEASCKLPTKFGDFVMYGFSDSETGKEHIALCIGKWGLTERVLTRVHSECLTGDALFSQRCDCGPQLQQALKEIADAGKGCLLYLRQEGRGIGLINKIRAYSLQEKGHDTVEANLHLGFDEDLRDYSLCKAMYEHLGLARLALMTNNPRKVKALRDLGFDVERLKLHVGRNENNEHYLNTKKLKLGHKLP